MPAPPLPVPAPLPGRWDRVALVEVGRIEIPKIGVDLAVGEGVEQIVIDAGPAHWPGTAAFGAWGNVVLAGHRSSLTAPFRRAAELVAGDAVVLSDASGTYRYQVTGTEVVPNTALWIVDQHPGRTLTIFTCHPIGSSAQRFVVRAELVSTPAPRSAIGRTERHEQCCIDDRDRSCNRCGERCRISAARAPGAARSHCAPRGIQMDGDRALGPQGRRVAVARDRTRAAPGRPARQSSGLNDEQEREKEAVMANIHVDVATMLGAEVVEISYKAEQLTVRTDASGVVSILGDIDSFTAPALHDALEPFVAARLPFRLDLSAVGFMGSVGVTELMDLDDRLGGRLEIVAASHAVARVIDAIGLVDRFVPGARTLCLRD